MKFALGLVLGSLALMLLGIAYVNYSMRARDLKPSSICGRQMQQGLDRFFSYVNVPVSQPEGTPEKYKEQLNKYTEGVYAASQASNEDFEKIFSVAVAAKRLDIAAKGILCIEPAVVAKHEALAGEYSADLAKRLKADPQSCKADYEKDIMAFIVRRFACR